MNLVRFMSTRELYRFLDGETISGNTEWRREGYASSSKGICFFPANPKPETRLHYLSGVVSFQRVVEFAPCGEIEIVAEEACAMNKIKQEGRSDII